MTRQLLAERARLSQVALTLVGASGAAYAASALLLLGLVLLSSAGTIAALVAVVLAVGLVALVALGPHRLGTVMVVAATFFGPMSSVRPVASVSVVTASDVFLLGGMTLLFPTLMRQRVRLPFTYQIGALLLVFAGVISSLLTDSPVVSLRYVGQLLVAVFVLPTFLAWWKPRMPVLLALAWAYVGGQVVSSVVALGQGGSRAQGLTTHPNFFGLCCTLAFALGFFLLQHAGRALTWVVVGLDALFALGVSMSGSRAALLGLVLLSLAWVLVQRSALGGYTMAFLGVAALAVGNWALGALPEGSALTRLRGDSTATVSDSHRQSLLQSGLHQFFDRPLTGNGFEQALQSHSIFLEVAVAGGLIGLIGYVVMLGALLKPLVDRANRLHALSYPVLAYALVGALSNSLWDRFIWTAAALGAVAMAEGQVEARHPSRHEVTAPPVVAGRPVLRVVGS
jgi:O-antigen ligase